MPERDPADGLPVQDLLVSRLQCWGVPDGELLLTPAELGVVLLDRHPLGVERRHDLIDHRSRHVHPVRGEAAAVVDRDECIPFLAGERPLGFEGRHQFQVALGRPPDHAGEKSASVRGVGLAVQGHHVDQDDAGVRRVGRDLEGRRVGHQPDLADRPHALDRCQVVEHGERLHR